MKNPSQVHAAFDGRTIKPYEMDAQDAASDFDNLYKLGIDIGLDNLSNMMVGYGMDAIQTGLTVPSIPSAVQFLQTFLPGFVRVATAPMLIDEIIGMQVVGSWEDEQVIQGFMEYTGMPMPYGDLTNVPLSSWNLNWIPRDVVRFEEGFRVGLLEEARTARVGVATAQAKRESAMLNLDIQRNQVGFFGFNGGNNANYGFLNDPNLLAYIAVPAGALASTLWANKTTLEIIADIRTAVVQLRTQSRGLIAPERTGLILVVPTNCYDYLTTVTSFGYSVMAWLKDSYPGIRVVQAPQLNNANAGSNVFYLFAEQLSGTTSTDDGKAFVQIVPAKFKVLGVATGAKGYEEDFSNATAGVLAKRPFAVTRFFGI